MTFAPKHTLGGKPLDLTHDLEALAHIEAEIREIILRSVAPHQVSECIRAQEYLLRTLAKAYSWKHQQNARGKRKGMG